jgi:hypothetical protein
VCLLLFLTYASHTYLMFQHKHSMFLHCVSAVFHICNTSMCFYIVKLHTRYASAHRAQGAQVSALAEEAADEQANSDEPDDNWERQPKVHSSLVSQFPSSTIILQIITAIHFKNFDNQFHQLIRLSSVLRVVTSSDYKCYWCY